MLKKKNIIPGYSFDTLDYLTKMTKKNYPKGTKYKCALYSRDIAIVEDEFSFYLKEEGNTEDSITDGCGGYVYFDGKWAEIIK